MSDPDRYAITVRKVTVDGEEIWRASVRELPDLAEFGATRDEAVASARDAIEDLQEVATEEGRSFPEPIEDEDDYSGRVTLRMPKHLHRAVAQRALDQDVSLNLYIVTQLAEGLRQPAQGTLVEWTDPSRENASTTSWYRDYLANMTKRVRASITDPLIVETVLTAQEGYALTAGVQSMTFGAGISLAMANAVVMDVASIPSGAGDLPINPMEIHNLLIAQRRRQGGSMTAKLPTKRDLRFLLAEDVRPEENGKLTVIGLFAGEEFLVLGQQPATNGPAFGLPSLSFMFILTGPSAGEFESRLKILAPDKKTVVMDAPAKEPVRKLAGSAAVFGTSAKPFLGPAFGTYTIQLDLGNMKFKFPFTVSLGSRRDSSTPK